jgi:hypothetical protein
MTNLTESQAIDLAKQTLSNPNYSDFTMSLMTVNDSEDFIWGYLFDLNLQYLKPINYINNNGFNSVVLIYQNN